MLVLTRKHDHGITLQYDDNGEFIAHIQFLGFCRHTGEARIGVEAVSEVKILRDELLGRDRHND